jgi:acyl-CoA dehydrogenase
VVELKGFPKLEGTRHVNMALIAKLLPNFFFNPKKYPEIPRRNGPENDDYLFAQGPTRGYGKIQFHDYNIAYNSVDLPNINVFKQQINAFVEWLMISGMELKDQMMNDFDFLLGVGEIFTLVAYGQLIIESAAIEKIDNELLNQIFDLFVRDFSRYAVDIHGKPTSTPAQKDQALKMIKSPVVDNDQFARVLEKHVYSLVDAYHMNP